MGLPAWLVCFLAEERRRICAHLLAAGERSGEKIQLAVAVRSASFLMGGCQHSTFRSSSTLPRHYTTDADKHRKAPKRSVDVTTVSTHI
jgi:hypothetical protein